ncbi:MAG: sensor histidine kinase [Blautia sp.]|nr:sensor histidine kinase [Blautia sp.]
MKYLSSLRWKLAGAILLFWVLPFILLVSMAGNYLAERKKKEDLSGLETFLQTESQICIERIDGAIADSRMATYDRTLYGAYQNYRKGAGSYTALYNTGSLFLGTQYGKKKEMSLTVLMLTENPYEHKMTSYNSAAGGSYRSLEVFWNKDCKGILQAAEELGTSIGLYLEEDRLYLFRNLLDTGYHPWGILVHRLNTGFCFEPLLKTFQEGVLLCVNLGGKEILRQGEASAWEDCPPVKEKENRFLETGESRIFAGRRIKGRDFVLETFLSVDTGLVFDPYYSYRYILAIGTAFLIPASFLFLWLSRRFLTVPIEQMVDAAHRIEGGELGYEFCEDMKSRELNYLRDSMNEMSRTLQHQFRHIYKEELALRDARIKALQSNINPHFMNNTLEIINWEARLGGNEKVSRMIEALATLMNAATDRNKRPLVPFSEEMVYVNAYLYIMYERLGKRLSVKKELPEETMGWMVPRLILQPIIENAVQHGVGPKSGGEIILRSYIREEKYLILEIENDGRMEKEDMEKVQKLLSKDYEISVENSMNIGIANVNQRLKILYGDPCGLSVLPEKDHVISRLCIGREESAEVRPANGEFGQENTRNGRTGYSYFRQNLL